MEWYFKRGNFSNRVLELKHGQHTAIWVEKIPPGDRFRFFMSGKSGNPIFGDLSTLHNTAVIINISATKIHLNLNIATGLLLQLSPGLRLSFQPNEAQVYISKEQNATFLLLAAFLLGSKVKRLL